MRTRTIRQKVDFPVAPAVVYAMLLDEKKHAAFTGTEVKIARRTGGNFSAYDGYISGKILSLEKNKRILQSWHASDMPEGHMSEVEFVLEALEGGRTRLHFTHTSVPADMYDAFYKGWVDFYWDPMQRYIAEHQR